MRLLVLDARHERLGLLGKLLRQRPELIVPHQLDEADALELRPPEPAYVVPRNRYPRNPRR